LSPSRTAARRADAAAMNPPYSRVFVFSLAGIMQARMGLCNKSA
jgi:hypothetical protein